MEKLKILVVDDNKSVLKLSQAIFELGGYEVVTANDGAEALHLLKSHTVILIMTDILMPNIDGYTLCYNIRNSEKTRHIPVIIYSATYISQSDEKLAIEIGADMFIRKPASMNFLLDAVKTIISQPRKQSDKTTQHQPPQVKQLYNSWFVDKLEEKNLELERGETERKKIVAEMVQRNNDLEQFSYIISHNLRAPVANILGIVNVLQTIDIDLEEIRTVTGYLAAAAQNLDNVILDINQILRIKNNPDLKREQIKFSDVVDEVKLSLGNLIHDKKISITGEFSGAEEVKGVKSYLYSIFFNLVSNSIKYQKPGIPAVIEITTSKTGNKTLIVFKDNGLGINLERNATNLFGMYKRFHHHVEGKSMGLFMVKAQVQSLGGKITVISEVNEGSEFTIELGEKP